MSETISIYYSPTFDVPTYGTAYHMTLVYTNSHGVSFATSAGPTIAASPDPVTAFNALKSLKSNDPSPYGVLQARTFNFDVGDPANRITFDDYGNPLQSRVVADSADLSMVWNGIVDTVNSISSLNIKYAPHIVNSNSVAGTALKAVGIAVPFDSGVKWVPGWNTTLPTTPSKLPEFLSNMKLAEYMDAAGHQIVTADAGMPGSDHDISIFRDGILTGTVSDTHDIGGNQIQIARGTGIEIDFTAPEILAVGEGNTYHLAGRGHGNIVGAGNTIHLTENSGSSIGYIGQNNVVDGTTGNFGVMWENSSSLLAYGTGTIQMGNSDQDLQLATVGATALTSAGVTGEAIHGSGINVIALGALNANIWGDSNTVHLVENSGSGAGFVGHNNSLFGTTGNFGVLYNDSSLSATGTGSIYMTGSNEELHLNTAGATAVTSSGVVGEAIYGSGVNVTALGLLNANVVGESVTVSLSADSNSSVGFIGHDFNVHGMANNYGVMYEEGSSGTFDGAGTIHFADSFQHGTLTSGADAVVDVGTNSAIIYSNFNDIWFQQGSTGTVYGDYAAITASVGSYVYDQSNFSTHFVMSSTGAVANSDAPNQSNDYFDGTIWH